MRKIIAGFLLLSLTVLSAGCGDERDIRSATSLPDPAPPPLEKTWDGDLDSLTYESVSVQVQIGAGGIFQLRMQTWPTKPTFAVFVPQNAIPVAEADGVNPMGPYVEFSISVPTYQSYLAHPDLPPLIRLQPSHYNFYAPIMVFGYFPSWQSLPPGPCYWFETGTGEWWPILELAQDKYGWRYRVELPHFSDWDAGNGADWPPPLDPPNP